jgi:hypothetical protein
MNRSRFLVAVLTLVGLLGAAEVHSASNAQQDRLQALRQQAEKERQSMNLDKSALLAKYPTPELKLVSAAGASVTNGGGDLPSVPVGSELTVSATGKFLPGSVSSMDCEGVVVTSDKVTDSRVEAKVKVTTNALAEECSLRVVSPVSLASARKPVFRVVGKYQWDLTLSNGMKARMRTEVQPSTVVITGLSEWTDKSGRALGGRQVKLERSTEGYRVLTQRTKEESAASDAAMQDSGKAFKKEDNQKAAAEIQAKMQSECLKMSPDKMSGCIQKYTAQMQALSQRVQAESQGGQQKAIASAVGCEWMNLAVSDGKVTGRGTNCGAPGEVNITGTFKATK